MLATSKHVFKIKICRNILKNHDVSYSNKKFKKNFLQILANLVCFVFVFFFNNTFLVVPTHLGPWHSNTLHGLSRMYVKSVAHILEALEIFTSSLKTGLMTDTIKTKILHIWVRKVDRWMVKKLSTQSKGEIAFETKWQWQSLIPVLQSIQWRLMSCNAHNREAKKVKLTKLFFTITAEILVRSLANFYRQYADRHMNLKFVRRVSQRERAIRPFVIVKNKLMSVFNESVLLLTMNFVITLSK